MGDNQIFFYPSYEMIFESSFDKLMEEVWGNKFMYISSWKVVGEGLTFNKILKKVLMIISLTITSETIP
jgi:hypothetical protein